MPRTAANRTPATGQMIHVLSQRPVTKLAAKYIAVIRHQYAPENTEVRRSTALFSGV